MSGSNLIPHTAACPFCGVATSVPHETQAGCIAALHDEIGRMRSLLATLKPAGARDIARSDDLDRPASLRLGLSKNDRL